MKIEDIDIDQLQQIAFLFSRQQTLCPFEVGKAYFIRTVTFHSVGLVYGIVGQFLVLIDCSWVASSGRYANALETGELEEVERMPDMSVVSLNSIVDASPWNHELPKDTK